MTHEQVEYLCQIFATGLSLVFWRDPRGGWRQLSGTMECRRGEMAAALLPETSRHVDLWTCDIDNLLVVNKAAVKWPA